MIPDCSRLEFDEYTTLTVKILRMSNHTMSSYSRLNMGSTLP